MERMVISSRSRHSLACEAVPCKALRKGFTIAECLISLLLLTVILVGGMAFYFYSTEYLSFATHRRMVTELANAEAEDIRNDGFASLPDPVPNGLWLARSQEAVTIGSLSGTKDVYVFDVPGVGYKQVEVRISWNEPGKTATQEIAINTYISL